MTQNVNTVTAPNPTPPTNLIFVGATPPNDPAQAQVDDGIPAFTGALATWNENAAGAGGPTRTVFNTNTAAAGSGTSVAHEGRGAETSFTQSYSAAILAPVPLVMTGVGPAYTTTPNMSHASSLTPASNPTLTSLGTPSSASGPSGTYSQTVTGVGFTKQSVIWVNGVPQATTFNSSTSLTAPAVTKKTSAGTWPVIVVTGGVVQTAPQTWTFT
jgi:hypothetical protein